MMMMIHTQRHQLGPKMGCHFLLLTLSPESLLNRYMCAITGPCLRVRHRPSAQRTVPIRKICQFLGINVRNKLSTIFGANVMKAKVRYPPLWGPVRSVNDVYKLMLWLISPDRYRRCSRAQTRRTLRGWSPAQDAHPRDVVRPVGQVADSWRSPTDDSDTHRRQSTPRWSTPTTKSAVRPLTPFFRWSNYYLSVTNKRNRCIGLHSVTRTHYRPEWLIEQLNRRN